MATNKVVLGVGSNSDDCSVQMRNAVAWLRTLLTDMFVSDIYSTPAINGMDSDYLNAVVSGCCECDSQALVALLKDYEKQCGRTPQSKLDGKIPVDIDIVVWNGRVERWRDFHQSYFQIGWKQLYG